VSVNRAIKRPEDARMDKRVASSVMGRADMEVKNTVLAAIDADPNNPRGEDLGDLTALTISIEESGVKQPIYLRYMAEVERYRIIEGHRRVEASRLARKSTIPAIILQDITDDEAANLAVMLNTQRQDIEQIRLRAINRRYKAQGMSVRQRQHLLGLSTGTISEWDKWGELLDAGIPLSALRRGDVDEQQARELLAEAAQQQISVEELLNRPVVEQLLNRPVVEQLQNYQTANNATIDEALQPMIVEVTPKPITLKDKTQRRKDAPNPATKLISTLRRDEYNVPDNQLADYQLAYDELGQALGMPRVFTGEQPETDLVNHATATVSRDTT